MGYLRNFGIRIALVGATILPSSLHAEWYPEIKEESDGTKCMLSTPSSYQEHSTTKRERSFINLIIRSFEPFDAKFELISGINSSLRTVSAIKINDDLFLVEFKDDIGELKNKNENDALLKALRSGREMSAAYRNSERFIYDKFIIKDLDKAIAEIRTKCALKG